MWLLFISIIVLVYTTDSAMTNSPPDKYKSWTDILELSDRKMNCTSLADLVSKTGDWLNFPLFQTEYDALTKSLNNFVAIIGKQGSTADSLDIQLAWEYLGTPVEASREDILLDISFRGEDICAGNKCTIAQKTSLHPGKTLIKSHVCGPQGCYPKDVYDKEIFIVDRELKNKFGPSKEFGVRIDFKPRGYSVRADNRLLFGYDYRTEDYVAISDYFVDRETRGFPSLPYIPSPVSVVRVSTQLLAGGAPKLDASGLEDVWMCHGWESTGPPAIDCSSVNSEVADPNAIPSPSKPGECECKKGWHDDDGTMFTLCKEGDSAIVYTPVMNENTCLNTGNIWSTLSSPICKETKNGKVQSNISTEKDCTDAGHVWYKVGDKECKEVKGKSFGVMVENPNTQNLCEKRVNNKWTLRILGTCTDKNGNILSQHKLESQCKVLSSNVWTPLPSGVCKDVAGNDLGTKDTNGNLWVESTCAVTSVQLKKRNIWTAHPVGYCTMYDDYPVGKEWNFTTGMKYTIDPQLKSSGLSNCKVPKIVWIGDKNCDVGSYNTKDCTFDGGDCCEQTNPICATSPTNPCACRDPFYSDEGAEKEKLLLMKEMEKGNSTRWYPKSLTSWALNIGSLTYDNSTAITLDQHSPLAWVGINTIQTPNKNSLLECAYGYHCGGADVVILEVDTDTGFTSVDGTVPSIRFGGPGDEYLTDIFKSTNRIFAVGYTTAQLNDYWGCGSRTNPNDYNCKGEDNWMVSLLVNDLGKMLIDFTFQWGTTKDERAVAVSSSLSNKDMDNIYVVSSTNKQVVECSFGSECGGTDILLTRHYKVNGTIFWSAQIGGTGTDEPIDMAQDNIGTVYVVGTSIASVESASSETSSCHKGYVCGKQDIILAKKDPLTHEFSIIHRWGGSGNDFPHGLVLDYSHGHAFITGFTDEPVDIQKQNTETGIMETVPGGTIGPCFSTSSPSSSSLSGCGGLDVFVTRVPIDIIDIYKSPVNATLDNSNSTITLTKTEPKSTFQLQKELDEKKKFEDEQWWSKVFGTSNAEVGVDIGIRFNRLFVIGNTESSKTLPSSTSDVLELGGSVATFANATGMIGDCSVGFQTWRCGGKRDIFLTEINPTNGDLLHSIRIGSPGEDGATGMKLDMDGNPIIVGYTPLQVCGLDGEFARLNACSPSGVDATVIKFTEVDCKPGKRPAFDSKHGNLASPYAAAGGFRSNGTYSSSMSTAAMMCVYCDEGYFSPYGYSCIPCPRGARCKTEEEMWDGSIRRFGSITPRANRGFFLGSLEGPARNYTEDEWGVVKFNECDRLPRGETVCFGDEASTGQSSPGNCIEGHAPTLVCGTCMDDYAMIYGQCWDCSPVKLSPPTFTAITYICLLLWFINKKYTELQKRRKQMRRNARIHPKSPKKKSSVDDKDEDEQKRAKKAAKRAARREAKRSEEANAKKKSARAMKLLRKKFDFHDRDGGGSLDPGDFKTFMSDLCPECPDKVRNALFAMIDVSRDNEIEFWEFKQWYTGYNDASAFESELIQIKSAIRALGNKTNLGGEQLTLIEVKFPFPEGKELDDIKKVEAWQCNVKCLIGYVQIIGSVLSLFEIPWPDVFYRFLILFNITEILNPLLEILPCASSSLTSSYLLKYELMCLISLPWMGALVYCLKFWLQSVNMTFLMTKIKRWEYWDYEPDENYHPIRRKLPKLLPNILFGVFIFLIPMTRMSLTIFDCREMHDGNLWLRADYTVQCYVGEHYFAVVLAWLTILVYPVGTFVVLAYALLKQNHLRKGLRRILINKQGDNLVARFRQYTLLMKPLRILHQEYNMSAHTENNCCGWSWNMYYELFQIFRRLLLAVILKWVLRENRSGPVIGSILTVMLCLFLHYADTWGKSTAKRFDQIRNSVLAALYIIGLYLQINPHYTQNNDASAHTVSIILIILVLTPICIAFDLMYIGPFYKWIDTDHIKQVAKIRKTFYAEKTTQTEELTQVEQENRDLRTKLHNLRIDEHKLIKERSRVDRKVDAAESSKTNLKTLLNKHKVNLSSLRKKRRDLKRDISLLKDEKNSIIEAMEKSANEKSRVLGKGTTKGSHNRNKNNKRIRRSRALGASSNQRGSPQGSPGREKYTTRGTITDRDARSSVRDNSKPLNRGGYNPTGRSKSKSPSRNRSKSPPKRRKK